MVSELMKKLENVSVRRKPPVDDFPKSCLIVWTGAEALQIRGDQKMHRFNRDFALIRSSTGQIMAESHSEERLEKLRTELAEEDIECEIIKSDLPRLPVPPASILTDDVGGGL